MSNQLYKLFCYDEATAVYAWDSTPPTVCPHNSNHSIDPLSVQNSTKYNDTFKAEEQSDGYFETTTVTMIVPAGTPGTVSEHDVTWPMDILLWNTRITPTTPMIDDVITVMAAPETTIGVLTVAASISDTVLNVNSTVIDNAYRGFLLTIDDTVNKDVVGRITNIDTGGSTITVETPLSFAYAPGTPVKISVYMVKDVFINDISSIDIGQKGFRGKVLAANQILRVYYTNNSGTEKTIRWRPEYYNVG